MSDVGFTEFQQHTVNSAEINARGFAMAPAGVKDDGKIVAFYYHAELNRVKSSGAGAPIYDNKIYVSVQNPGEKDCIKREARDEDKHRWPGQWQAFQQGRKFISDGTPLEHLFPNRPDIVATLNQFNIQTVQQLAGLSGDAISRAGIGVGNWVEDAKRYLASASKGVDFHRFEQERQKWTEEKGAMQKQITDLGNQVRQLIQGQTQRAMPQPGYDAQSHVTANTMNDRYPPMQTIPEAPTPEAVDLSGYVQTSGTQPIAQHFTEPLPAKRKGRPAGSKNKPKETI